MASGSCEGDAMMWLNFLKNITKKRNHASSLVSKNPGELAYTHHSNCVFFLMTYIFDSGCVLVFIATVTTPTTKRPCPRFQPSSSGDTNSNRGFFAVLTEVKITLWFLIQNFYFLCNDYFLPKGELCSFRGKIFKLRNLICTIAIRQWYKLRNSHLIYFHINKPSLRGITPQNTVWS